MTGGRWAAEQYGWSRIDDHDHSFYRSSPETRTAVLVRDGDETTVISGFYGLTVLKTTQSGFVGYPKDKYTTLAETEDRILATDIATRWRYNTTDIDFNAVYEAVKATMLTTFSQGYSKALQQTLYQMAEAVLREQPSIEEIKFSCPNKHHFTSDLSFCGLDNPNEVFYAADRPYGLIEATVQRGRQPVRRCRLDRCRRILLGQGQRNERPVWLGTGDTGRRAERYSNEETADAVTAQLAGNNGPILVTSGCAFGAPDQVRQFLPSGFVTWAPTTAGSPTSGPRPGASSHRRPIDGGEALHVLAESGEAKPGAATGGDESIRCRGQRPHHVHHRHPGGES